MTSEEGKVYAGFIEDQLVREYARSSSLDDRGWKLLQVVGASLGFLTTALGALGLPQGWLLAITVACASVAGLSFSTAFVLAAMSLHLRAYPVADVPTLSKMAGEKIKDSAEESLKVTSRLQVGSIKGLREANGKKAESLARGIVALGGGLGLGAAALACAAANSVV